MNNDFFKKILKEIDFPVKILNDADEVVMENNAFKNLENNEEAKQYVKSILIDGKNYKIITYENSNNQAHQDFISTVSHELRTPLTSIRGFADTMLIAADKLSKEQQSKFLTIIRNQSDRLTRLVENLLAVSNMSKISNLIFKEIDFQNFIRPLITIFEKKYPDRNYVIKITENLPFIWADSDVLEQIMTNLIDNASKYSAENSTITIIAEYYQNEIMIKVVDEAVKIPTEQLENIFKKFARIDNPLTRKVEGSGLGLFITKSLVQKINAKIKAENYENGNIFTVELQSASVEKQLSSKMSGEKD